MGEIIMLHKPDIIVFMESRNSTILLDFKRAENERMSSYC